jgi:hypothetical protein
VAPPLVSAPSVRDVRAKGRCAIFSRAGVGG